MEVRYKETDNYYASESKKEKVTTDEKPADADPPVEEPPADVSVPDNPPAGEPALDDEPDAGDVIVDSDIGENAPGVGIDLQTANQLKEEVITEHLTEEEKETVASGAALEIILSVEDAGDTVSQQDKLAAESILAGTEYELGQYLSIDIVKLIGGQQAGMIAELSTLISITIEVPENLRKENRVFAVLRVHDGAAEILEDQDDDPQHRYCPYRQIFHICYYISGCSSGRQQESAYRRSSCDNSLYRCNNGDDRFKKTQISDYFIALKPTVEFRRLY